MNIELLSKPTELKDIDFRVQSVSPKGYCTVLGYKDARYDMNRLDEAVGAMNWGKDYREIKGHLFCGVWIRGEDGEKVWKWDVGTESNTEATKGEASDAFKRACFNWNIGRDLYDLPSIRFQLLPEEYTEHNGKAKTTFKLNLNKWTWNYFGDNGEHLGARDSQNRVRYDSRKDYNPAP